MTSLFEQGGIDEVMQRMEKLTPATTPQWGKMNAGQMVAHVRMPVEVAVGTHTPPPLFIMKIFGPMIRKKILSDKPLKKNSPTGPTFIMNGDHDLEQEKKNLKKMLDAFAEKGRSGQLPPRHVYFGKMSHADWDYFMQRHLEHHLTQFGV